MMLNLTPTRPNQTSQSLIKTRILNLRKAVSNPAVLADSFHSPRFSGKPSLIAAISTDDPKKLQAALNQGADLHENYQEPLQMKSFISSMFGGRQYSNEMNALHVAVDRNTANPECLQILLDKGIKINSTESDTGWTALHRHMYQYNPNEAATKKLLEQGVDVNAKDSSGKTALHVLMDHRYFKEPKPPVMKLLREYGADLHARDESGNTPLDIMAHRTEPVLKAAQYLIRTGSTQSERDALKKDFLASYQRANRNFGDCPNAKALAEAQQLYQKNSNAIQAFSTAELTGSDKLNFKTKPSDTTSTTQALKQSEPAQSADVKDDKQPENKTSTKPQQTSKKEKPASLWTRFMDSIAKMFEAFLDLFRSSKKK